MARSSPPAGGRAPRRGDKPSPKPTGVKPPKPTSASPLPKPTSASPLPKPTSGKRSPSRADAVAAPPTIPRGQLIYGLHAVRAAWANPQRRCHRLYLSATAREELATSLPPHPDRPTPEIVLRETLDALTPPDSVHQGAVLAADPLPELTLAEALRPPRPLLVLDQISDPQNLGAILRTAAAFGACAVLAPDRHTAPLSAPAVKVASGAAELVPMVRVANLVRSFTELREAGYWLVGLAEQGEQRLDQVDLRGAVALVLGAEDTGLRRLVAQGCDHLAKLPTQPPLQSLNVATAAAVALYEVVRQAQA